MDRLDREILNIIQDGFPLDARPFRTLGARVGIDEDDTLKRIGRLKNEGIIRRIGAVFDTGNLGFTSTLCAAKVPADRLEKFVDIVNSYRGVTHNYLRDYEYNVWFTFIAPTENEIEKSLSDISRETGISNIINMPVKRRLKIDARFRL
ncbi:MAG: AsnC family transcriptional regulator [Deltaproteobacteria bacterium]|nr:AsnC family transcriptional regulator [Deltaproteobacteria bacterium]MBW2648779.1 AsnC family transcriptional regulator [Deltaproteobacteria bacterium]